MSESVLSELAEQVLLGHQNTCLPHSCECFRCRSLRDLLDSRARVKELEKWRDAVLSIVDSLDDPLSELTWLENSREVCAAELEHIRSALVPLVRGEEEER